MVCGCLRPIIYRSLHLALHAGDTRWPLAWFVAASTRIVDFHRGTSACVRRGRRTPAREDRRRSSALEQLQARPLSTLFLAALLFAGVLSLVRRLLRLARECFMRGRLPTLALQRPRRCLRASCRSLLFTAALARGRFLAAPRSGLRFLLGCLAFRWHVNSGLARLRKTAGYRLLGRTCAVLAHTYMLNLFAHELPRQQQKKQTNTQKQTKTNNGFLFGHG